MLMGGCVFQWLLKVYLCSEGLSVCNEFPGLNVGGVSLCTQGCPCLGPLSGFRRREGMLLGFFAVCCTVRPLEHGCVSRWCAHTCVQLRVPVHLHTLWGVLQSKCGGRICVGSCRDASRSAGCRLADQLGRLSSLTTCCMLAVCPSLWGLMCARQMSMVVTVRLCGLMPSNVFWQTPITALIPAIVN